MAPHNEGNPQEESAGFKGATGGGVQVNGDAAGPAVAGAASELKSNVVAIKSGAAVSGTLLTRWKLIGRAARDARLSRSDVAVLYAVADRIGETGTAWPSVRTIADDAGADPRTVTRSINRLCGYGYLFRQSGGFTTSNKYRLGMGEPAHTGESTPTGDLATTGKVTGTGKTVAGYGRTRLEGMGGPAHVILPVNPSKESTQDSSTAAPLTADPGAGGMGSEAERKRLQAAQRAQRLTEVTRDAVETFNASRLTKVNGGLVPNVTAGVGEDKRRKQVAKSLAVARDICRHDFESEVIVRDFWAEYWELCASDEHKSGRNGGGKNHGNWLPSFEYLTREATMLEVYDRAVAAATEGAK